MLHRHHCSIIRGLPSSRASSSDCRRRA
jgi:hypothetical protein